MPTTIVITGTAAAMGRATVCKFAAEGKPLHMSSAATGANAAVYPVGERNGARSRLQELLPGHLVSEDGHAPGEGGPESESVSGVMS